MNRGREFTLSELSDQKLHSAVIADIEKLLAECASKKFKPVYIIVGNLFLELGCIRELFIDLKLNSFSDLTKGDLDWFSSHMFHKKLKWLESIENSDGEYGYDPVTNLRVFFDPDEDYFSLVCVNPKQKAKKGESATKDGYLVCNLTLPINEILPEYTLPYS